MISMIKKTISILLTKPHSFIIRNLNNKEYLHIQLQFLGKKTKQPIKTFTAFDRVIVTEQIKNWKKANEKRVTGDFSEEIVLQAEKIIKKCNVFFLRYELFRYVKRTKWT